MKLGAHLSIAGGIEKAVEAAGKIGTNTLQIFSGSPRGWECKEIKKLEIEKFRNLTSKQQITPVFIHAKYLVNLASDNPTTVKKSVDSLVEDLKFAAKIGAKGVVFHPRAQNFKRLIKSIRRVLTRSPKSAWLILENSAQMELETIGKIIKAVKNRRLKFCLDLAHTYQQGYNLTASSGLTRVFEIIDKEIGFERWVVIHTNDSKTACGSKNDRHEDIGKGKLRTTPFFIFLNHPFSRKLPFILETPGFGEKGLAADRKNLTMLKKLVGKHLEKKFFLQPTLKVARQLLGKYLIVNRAGRFQVGRIVETEAYVGPEDKASHASRGRTPRTEIMWGPAGRLYVYLIYGMYHCLNIVTEPQGYPAAVLIRAVEPVFGISTKTNGPGKLSRELKITTKDTGLDISKSNKIYIKDIGERPKKIITTPRIGVDYAGQWAKKKWRFIIPSQKVMKKHSASSILLLW